MRSSYEMDDMRDLREIRNAHIVRIRRRWLVVLLTAAVFVGGALASGIIGNIGSDIATKLWGWVTTSLGMNWLPWAISGVVLVVSLSAVLYWWWHSKVLSRALTTTNNLVELDDSLLRLLASWIQSRDHQSEMRRLLAELLKDASAEFHGQVHRASILLPDPNVGGTYLKIWAHFGMPQDSVDRIRFRITQDEDDQTLPGVAGEAFLSERLRVAHMTLENNTWRSDCPSFTPFHKEARFPAYRSFACVPILGVNPNAFGGNTITCLGVACFDSLDQTIFDDFEVRTVLRVFARRIGAALLIYHQLP